MSWQASKAAARLSVGSATAKAVLLILAEAADARGTCTLSQKTIGERAELVERTVWAALDHLTKRDLIRRERRPGKRGERLPDRIILTFAQPAADAASLPAGNAASVGTPTRKSCEPYPQLLPVLPASPAGHIEVSSKSALEVSKNARDVHREAGSNRRAPSRCIPPGFPTDDLIEQAQQQARAAGVNIDMSIRADRFRAWAQSRDHRRADWDTFWLKWATDDIERAPKLFDYASERLAPEPRNDAFWRRWFGHFSRAGWWDQDELGPPPSRPGCMAPTELLVEFGFPPGGGRPSSSPSQAQSTFAEPSDARA